jgi:hypothetical protein
MNWNRWIRQIHRWLSIAFTVAVIVTFVALRQEKPPVWVNFLALPPLFLLLFTGLYLFVLPHATRWRSGRRTDSTGLAARRNTTSWRMNRGSKTKGHVARKQAAQVGYGYKVQVHAEGTHDRETRFPAHGRAVPRSGGMARGNP